jgi:Transposase DDE domain group 1
LHADCSSQRFLFQGPGQREIVAAFDGGRITSDGGVLLLGEVDRRRRIVGRFAACFDDARECGQVEHSVEELLRQRVFALALGYEDLNDHDELRSDALLAAVVGKSDPTGEARVRERDRGKALAGKSTLHRLEWGESEEVGEDRYRRIAVSSEAVDAFFVEVFLDAYDEAPEEIVLDLDATDNPLYGRQEGRFFHGYYGCYCYLPLYVFCGRHLLCARLRRSNIDASAGSVEELERIVGQIHERWPEVRILVRGDSGFAREALMAWCEKRGVDYVFGLARNARLEAALEPAFEQAEELSAESQKPERVYDEWMHSTLDSWSCERRVIGKAEITWVGENPRFVVTSLSPKKVDPRTVYETIYCARGDMENRIKEQLDLFATRTPGRLMRVNQVRLWLSSVAYVLLDELRRLGLDGTSMATAYCSTLRLKLLKIGARVRVTTRKIWVSLASAYPYADLFARAYDQLQRAGP